MENNIPTSFGILVGGVKDKWMRMKFNDMTKREGDDCLLSSNVLNGWGTSKHTVEGDGNCSFTAVAFSLISNSAILSV